MKNPESVSPVIYQTRSGALELRGDFKKETIWATQAQMIEIFEIDQSVISRHIKNIFSSGEVDEKSNMQKMHNAHSDKPVTLYSLDIILAVGYRANSSQAITFRQWASSVLRKHITEGYTINRSRIETNYTAFLQAVEDIKKLLPAGGQVDVGSVLELVQAFADTWFSLDAYDHDTLILEGATQTEVSLTADELTQTLAEFRSALIEKGEATELFGRERERGSVGGIVGNVFQSFGGDDVYPSVEAKAAHLLYFVVKNHPFIDGNKRSGAYAFVWFLSRTGTLDRSRITPPALTALTLLIAESNPAHKDRMIGLVLQILGNTGGQPQKKMNSIPTTGKTKK